MHMVRLGVYRESPSLFNRGYMFGNQAGFLAPTYVGFWQRLYVALQSPQVGVAGFRRTEYTLSVSEELTAGYLLTPQTARWRPYAALTYSARLETQRGTNLTAKGYQPTAFVVTQRTSFSQFLMPTVGLYVRISSKIWVDIAALAPSGHVIVSGRIEHQRPGGSYDAWRLLPKSYGQLVPYTQAGISYHFE
jgi:hypothetical protein